MTQSQDEGLLLVDDSLRLGLGELARYRITIDRNSDEFRGLLDDSEVHLTFKNTESALLKPIYLTGPYSFYVDVQPHNYNEFEKFGEDVQFCDDVKPNDTFRAVLKINENSRIESTSKHSWQINISCQLSVTKIPLLAFRLCISTEKLLEMPHMPVSSVKGFMCEKWDTQQLWNLPPRFLDRPVHLVILTHGIFSNIGCDMVYLKDRIEDYTRDDSSSPTSNVVIRGYMGNQGRSSKGIKANGIRMGKFIIDAVDEMRKQCDLKYISFVGHSLGGPTQSMALRYVCVERADIFDPEKGLEPIHFITLASPYLGVAGEVPPFVTIAFNMGVLGQTGADLNLNRTFFTSKDGLVKKGESLGKYKFRPLLEIIPSDPVISLIQRFKNRTTYANVLHDGIVPLRTAALLYLDWKGLGDVRGIRQGDGKEDEGTPEYSNKNNTTGEIPEEKMDKKSALKYVLPQAALRRGYKRYQRTQTKSPQSDGNSDDPNHKDEIAPPPNANPLISAANIIIAPLPTQEYLRDPEERADKIIHDKLYYPDELPPPHYRKRDLFKKIIYPNDRIYRVQERIARQWQETCTWRKVLVSLEPDSHNNIVVRRKFVNAFGWVVVDHLARNHFGSESHTNGDTTKN
ncbi:LAME_0H11738g1_1 [Lachancea meyersii CBS 8951]|uniref:LAME_0H11738g1_1 n=1 Tax=Lachancea meyersii CBS 8951 TaxID=1266667 RepID=A0A1G4KGI9_9SACH|nr:LAME_0H11738g1_1 [Lachancea meyersii CBS 8951]